MSQIDTLDRRQQMSLPLIGSLAVHGAVIGSLFVTWAFHKSLPDFGDEKISHGAVGVSVTHTTIPIPQRDGRVNRLASDTKSIVPQAPPVKKQPAKAVQPDPKAIPLPGKPLKPKPEATRQPLYKPQPYRPDQVYSRTQEALKSPDLGMQGNEGVGLGPNSVLGFRFGYYVDLMRTAIAKHWSTAGLAGDKRRVLVTFTILRDGSVKDAKVERPSGNYTLDTSALRAVLESSPLPQLPAGYDKDSAPVELWFQAK